MKRYSNSDYQYFESGPIEVSEVDNNEFELPEPHWPLHEIGVVQLNSNGEPCNPTDGTYTVRVKTIVNDQFETFPNNEIDAAAPKTITVDGIIHRIRVTSNSVSGDDLTFFRVRVISRRYS